MLSINGLLRQTLNDEGFVGTVNDALRKKLVSLVSPTQELGIDNLFARYLIDQGYSGSFPGMLYRYLGDKGYTGSLPKRFHDALIAGDLFAFNPASLFKNGEDGDYWDSTDASSLTEFSTGDPISEGDVIGGFLGQLGVYNYNQGLVASPAKLWMDDAVKGQDEIGVTIGTSSISLANTESWSVFTSFTASGPPSVSQVDLMFINQQGSGLHFGGLEFTTEGKLVYAPTDNGADSITSTAVVTDGEAHTAGFIHDAGTGTFSLYVDGVLQGQSSSVVGTVYAVNGFYVALGDRPADSITQRWHWKQLIINRAISSADIASLHGWLISNLRYRQATTYVMSDSVSTDENVAYNGSFLYQSLYGTATSFAVTSGPTNGETLVSGDGYTYTPDTAYEGSDSFDFTATADGTTSPAATVSVTVVPAPETIFYDTFTSGSLENLSAHTPDTGTSWNVDADVTAEVSGGEVVSIASAAPSTNYVSDAVTASRTVKFQVGTVPGVTGAVTRRLDGSNFVAVQYVHATSLLRLVTVVGGSLTSVTQSSASLSSSDVVEVTDDGSNIAVYVNGVESIPAEAIGNFSANPAAGIFVAASSGDLTAFAVTNAVDVTGIMP